MGVCGGWGWVGRWGGGGGGSAFFFQGFFSDAAARIVSLRLSLSLNLFDCDSPSSTRPRLFPLHCASPKHRSMSATQHFSSPNPLLREIDGLTVNTDAAKKKRDASDTSRETQSRQMVSSSSFFGCAVTNATGRFPSFQNVTGRKAIVLTLRNKDDIRAEIKNARKKAEESVGISCCSVIGNKRNGFASSVFFFLVAPQHPRQGFASFKLRPQPHSSLGSA